MPHLEANLNSSKVVARKRNEESATPEPELTVSADEAASKLDVRLATGRELLERQVFSTDEYDELDADYGRWDS
jgi:hypothetical protein